MDVNKYQSLVQKYKDRVAEEFGESPKPSPRVSSHEYSEFKRELYPAHYSWYEKACTACDKILKLKVDPVKQAKIQKALDTCHLSTTPAGVTSFSLLVPMAVMIFGSLLGFAIFRLPFFVFFFLISGAIMIPAFQKIPFFLANTWRLKASNQMIQSIFYMVTYMRHTSNLERAIGFAADHLSPPLSLDFRKILWDVETQRYSTIRDAANAYLESWKDASKDFVEAFHLIESSLFEGAEERRLALLDKSLEVVLNGTYESMLHYAHALKTPLTILHMLGVILPILGLVILPLVVSFLGSGDNPLTTALYISMLYNVTLPVGVFFLGKNILSKRPGGYGASDISSKLKKLTNVNLSIGKLFTIQVNPLYFSIMIFVVTALIGVSPLILHAVGSQDFSFDKDGQFKLLDYVCPPCSDKVVTTCGPGCDPADRVGPYGLGASLLSVFFVAGLGLSIGLYYKLRSKNVIKIREKTKELEDEFSSALFQLGNRLGDGIPAEIAFSKVARTMAGSTSGDFFNIAEKNITKLGMGLEQSIFDPKVGAIASYPSSVIESSMKVLVESIKKGPLIAAQALLSMASYIKEIHRVEERLKDLMSDIISSMKAQVKFLTPAIAGIVIGITAMISTILTKLSAQLGAAAGSGTEQYGDLLSIFGIGIPTFHFQLVVGVYVVQLAWILTTISNGVENGADPLGERFQLGQNMTKGVLLYCIIAGIVMVLFNVFATNILKNVG